MQVEGDVISEPELGACQTRASKSKSLISRYRNEARDAVSVLNRKSRDIFFTLLAYDLITTTVSRKSLNKRGKETKETFSKLYKLTEVLTVQNR